MSADGLAEGRAIGARSAGGTSSAAFLATSTASATAADAEDFVNG